MFGLRQHHLLGLLIGAGVGLVASLLGKVVGYSLSPDDGIFWGGVTGGILAGTPQFVSSGAVLTGGDNRALNLIVGVVGSLVVLVVTAAVAILLARWLF